MTEVLKQDWVETTLGAVVEVIGGGTPKTNVSEYWNGDIPWLSVADFNSCNKYVYDAEKKITELGVSKSSTKILNKDDIIISARGTVGAIAMIGIPMAFNQSCYGIRAKENSDIHYIFYCLKDAVAELKSISHGAVFDTITKDTFDKIEISLPSPPEQQAIAEILSSLDDKIDLLNRQNKTLEALAETLFRQWFIEEADEAWEEKPLDKIAEYLNGLACQKYPVTDENKKLPVLKIKDLRSGISAQSDWSTSDIPSEYIITAGDVVFSWSGSLLVKIWDGQDCILNQHLFKVSSKNYPKWFYYLWTNFYLEKFIAIAETKATTMGHIKRADLSSSMVIVPDATSLSDMNNQMIPLFEKIVKNNSTILSLTNLRDTLLPKLMSGEVRVLS